jgi:hypothetical protein
MPADGLAAFLEGGIFGTSRFVGSFDAHIYQLTVIEKGLPLGKRCNAAPQFTFLRTPLRGTRFHHGLSILSHAKC